MSKEIRIALTGFMGVGKSSVSRHLANILRCKRVDLDHFIETNEKRKIASIIDTDGLDSYRRLESDYLIRFLEESNAAILSLGGGTFTIEANRRILKEHDFTSVWLESSFEHCWLNISFSRKDRPLARDKESARALFEERQEVYCLADWHFIVRPDFTSYDVAKKIADEVFG
jgi:shikimate kinase